MFQLLPVKNRLDSVNFSFLPAYFWKIDINKLGFYTTLLKSRRSKHDVHVIPWSCRIFRQWSQSRISYAVCHLIFLNYLYFFTCHIIKAARALIILTDETTGVFIHAAPPFAIGVRKIGRAAQRSVHFFMPTRRLKGPSD